MHHRDDLVLREGAIERRSVHEVARNERSGDEAAVAGREIVENHRMITGREQCAAAMRADIARAAGDQNGRSVTHVSSSWRAIGAAAFVEQQKERARVGGEITPE